MLCLALLLQACGIALPAVAAGAAPALVAAVLFGGTVLGIVSMALTLGNDLRLPRAVAILTSGYGLGQIAGPLVATPLLRGGYHVALLVGAAIVLTAALAAAALAISFPGREPNSGPVPAMRVRPVRQKSSLRTAVVHASRLAISDSLRRLRETRFNTARNRAQR